MNLQKTTLALVERPLQSYGLLVVLTFEKEIIGISSELQTLVGEADAKDCLGLSFEMFSKNYFKEDSYKLLNAIDKILYYNSPRQMLLQSIGGQQYYVSIYRHDTYIYMEWELQTRKSISALEMNEIGFLFERKPKEIWTYLCKAIQQLLHYDRVMIFNYEGFESGEILAEYCKEEEQLFKGKHFSSAFMPQEIIEFYETRSYRYSPNLNEQNQTYYTIDHHADIQPTVYQTFPSLHAHYLRSIGIVSVIMYPICINDSFWGLLIAHNQEQKEIDLQKRKLGSFIVQNAASKYEGIIKNKMLDYREQMKGVELDLKGKLLYSKTINCALVQSMEVLCKLPHADGLIIFHKGDIFGYGVSPSNKQVRMIVDFICDQPKRPLFKDNNFSLKHGANIEGELPFAGLMALQIGRRDDHFMIWLRREKVREITQVTISEEYKASATNISQTYQIWEDIIYNTALPWNEEDVSFIWNLDKLINDAIVVKAKEYEKFNEELIRLNNEMEMLTFTLSHDLKNPLSIVKMGVRFLELNENLPIEQQRKWYASIREGIDNIELMIKNIMQLNNANSYNYVHDPVLMSHMVTSLCDDFKLLYNSTKCHIILGELSPIWGEKSALYQIFSNVIGNAIKYSAQGPSPEVSIASHKIGDNMVYTISDNGIGIPTDQLERVYEVFGRGSNVHEYEGTGIGLCLVKRIMGRLGGSIEIESQLGKGTMVKLIFPSQADFPTFIQGIGE